MDNEEIRNQIKKLESEIDSIRESIRPLLLDLEERKSTYAMLTGRLN